MERRFRKADTENDYKYMILQIGRKYTFVGFCGLHKPVLILETPNIFMYNEKFHSFEENEEVQKQVCELVSRKMKNEKRGNGKLERSESNRTLVHKDDNKGATLVTEKIKIDKKEENEKEKESEKSKETTLRFAHDIESSEFSCNNISSTFIYHYEYKYNQNSKLWEIFFEEFIMRIFQKMIRTNTKSRKVVLVLNMFMPSIINYSLCKCLLQHHEISSISYINDLVSPLFTANSNTCVVLDLGYTHCRVLPVLNGFPLYHHYTYINNGGLYINQEIKRLLKEQYKEKRSIDFDLGKKRGTPSKNTNMTDVLHEEDSPIEPFENEEEVLNYYYNLYSEEEINEIIDSMSDEDIETLKVKYFYLKNTKTNLISTKYVLFEVNHHELIIDHEIRWKACEILFEKKYEQNLFSLFYNLIEKLNHLDYHVLNNILICGGCGNIKGILSRIAEVMHEIIQTKNKYISNFEEQIKFIFPRFSPNLRQFVGASIYANLENLPEYTEEHINNNVLHTNLSEDLFINFKN